MKKLFLILFSLSLFIFNSVYAEQAVSQEELLKYIKSYNSNTTNTQTTTKVFNKQEVESLMNQIISDPKYTYLNEEDEYYLTFKEGQTVENFVKELNAENLRRKLAGNIQGQLPNPFLSTTQNPPENRPQLSENKPPITDPSTWLSLTEENKTSNNKTSNNSNVLNQLVNPSVFNGKDEGKEPLSRLLNQLFYVGLLIAVIAAIVVIIMGGVQYMTVDAISSKEGGKNKVKAALGGLLLAFSAILIFNSINPGITSFIIKFPTLSKVSPINITGVDKIISDSVANYNQITPEQYAEMIRTGKIPEGLTDAGKKILAEALNAVGNLNTGAIPGTDNGNKACAAAVNRIVQAATGQQVGGGLSTAAMYEALQTNSNFQLIGSNYANAQPGDIIISPTSGGSVGHVGIVASQGARAIISNSSSKAQVLQNHTADSWDRVYGGKGLPTYIYRPL